MTRSIPIAAFCLTVLPASMARAAQADAALIQKSHQLALEKWALEMNSATTPEQRAKTWSAKPDTAAFARRMWDQIGASLSEEWTLEPAAWFLRNTQGLLTRVENGATTPIFAKENDAIRKAVESQHAASKKLIPMCLALAYNQDPRSLALLEKIQSNHPDKRIQGVAALGAAMQLKAIGDEPELMKKRLTYLRKAIIESSDVEVEGTTVAKLAEDELYIIRYLTKGRVAPDLVGVDAANRPLSLSSQKGKIIVLLFWSSSVQDADRVVEITSALARKFANRPFAVIGVNHDPLEKLRAMEADGAVNWPNFTDPERKLAAQYRVGTWPLAYVLDGERKIHFAGAPGSFVELTAEALLAELK